MIAIETWNENDGRSIDKRFPWHSWFSAIKISNMIFVCIMF